MRRPLGQMDLIVIAPPRDERRAGFVQADERDPSTLASIAEDYLVHRRDGGDIPKARGGHVDLDLLGTAVKLETCREQLG